MALPLDVIVEINQNLTQWVFSATLHPRKWDSILLELLKRMKEAKDLIRNSVRSVFICQNEGEKANVRSLIANIDGEIQALRGTKGDLERKVEDLRALLEQRNGTIMGLQLEVETLEQQIKFAKDMLEGFQAVLPTLQTGPATSDLIELISKKYWEIYKNVCGSIRISYQERLIRLIELIRELNAVRNQQSKSRQESIKELVGPKDKSLSDFSVQISILFVKKGVFVIQRDFRGSLVRYFRAKVDRLLSLRSHLNSRISTLAVQDKEDLIYINHLEDELKKLQEKERSVNTALIGFRSKFEHNQEKKNRIDELKNKLGSLINDWRLRIGDDKVAWEKLDPSEQSKMKWRKLIENIKQKHAELLEKRNLIMDLQREVERGKGLVQTAGKMTPSKRRANEFDAGDNGLDGPDSPSKRRK
eukprot:TRINITY_DN152_c0_g2_i2.p1 TRINITY_DN152_c0_g2~~TRINITY_DN152_c0_g2_i2.p1  ORF type:complete len:417 (+),score=79.46 TRINITY_DN152_c0_g2_i2:75-1325(+)